MVDKVALVNLSARIVARHNLDTIEIDEIAKASQFCVKKLKKHTVLLPFPTSHITRKIHDFVFHGRLFF